MYAGLKLDGMSHTIYTNEHSKVRFRRGARTTSRLESFVTAWAVITSGWATWIKLSMLLGAKIREAID